MATMPDIDTSVAGVMGYYNIIDNTTVDSIDPTATVDASSVVSYDQWDNGVTGEMDIGRGSRRYANFRVKTDGWIVVWLDRTYNYALDVDPGDYFGDMDLIGTLAKRDQLAPPTTLTDTAIANRIQELFNEIDADKSGVDLTWDASDVMWYHYGHEDATNIALSVEHINSTGQTTKSVDISYPDTITPLTMELWGHAYSYGVDPGYSHFEGTTLAHSEEEDNEFGIVDASNYITDSGTTYTGELYCDYDYVRASYGVLGVYK